MNRLVAIALTVGCLLAARADEPLPLLPTLDATTAHLRQAADLSRGYVSDLSTQQGATIIELASSEALPAGRYRLHALVTSTPHDHILVDAVELRLRVGDQTARYERLRDFPDAGAYGHVWLDIVVQTPQVVTIAADWLVGESMLEKVSPKPKHELQKIYLTQRQYAIDRLAIDRQPADASLEDDLDLGGLDELDAAPKTAGKPRVRDLNSKTLPTYRIVVKGLALERLSPIRIAAVLPTPEIVEADGATTVTLRLTNNADSPQTASLSIAHSAPQADAIATPIGTYEIQLAAGETTTWSAPEPLAAANLTPLTHLPISLTVAGLRPELARGTVVVVPPPRPARATPPTRTVFAHYMGCWPAATGPLMYERTTSLPDNFRHESKDAAMARGGHVRNFDLAPPTLKLTPEQSADLEIRRAMRIGIDGFAVDAWAGGDDARRTLDALFAAAEAGDYPFQLTVCIDPISGGNVVSTVKEILAKHGDSPKLARRDGKPLIFGYQSIWSGFGYVQRAIGGDRDAVMRQRATPLGWHLLGQAFVDAERQIGQDIFFHYDLAWFFHEVPGDLDGKLPAAAAILARYVDAVGSFKHEKGMADIAPAVTATGAEWSGAVGMYQKENIPFETYTPKGTEWLLGSWSGIREQDATLLQIITWNDYGENTAIAPGWDTRYTIYDLTGYQIQWWKSGKQPTPDHDRVYLIYAKYPRGAKVWPFSEGERRERALEVVTILTAPATIRLPGRDVSYDAPAGYHVHQVPLTAGPVIAELLRDGAVALRLESPEPITDRPFRESNGFVCYSSEFARHWQADFPDAPVFDSAEYGDVDGDGLPNWFEMYWFSAARGYKPVAEDALGGLEEADVAQSRWLDFSTAGIADPDADPDRDGQTNLEEYRARTDPTVNTRATITADPADLP